jgi:hypothetical protein
MDPQIICKNNQELDPFILKHEARHIKQYIK